MCTQGDLGKSVSSLRMSKIIKTIYSEFKRDIVSSLFLKVPQENGVAHIEGKDDGLLLLRYQKIFTMTG